MSETLIIYSRYPEPGTTKTRMIPILGAEGAAELQRQMSEYTLNTARQLKKSRNINLEVHFAGGTQQLMSDWLGQDISYIKQTSGDLGEKMKSSFQQAFDRQHEKVIIIGIDCPDIDLAILNQAFNSLRYHDLVLGEAKDGGYYLIGLNKLIPQLFDNITWGTNKVLNQTKAIADKLSLNTEYLMALPDVDRPEDLSIWHKYT